MAEKPRKITDRRLNSNRKAVGDTGSTGKAKRLAPKPKKKG